MALVPVHMPKFGMTMTEGLITQWHVEEGATVREGDLLFSVETEKATADVDAPAAGVVVKISAAAQSEVPVGSVVAYIETND
jgi:pyruvate dehydrogenase E2 component (dihydrolipoamide acetyltransferase)